MPELIGLLLLRDAEQRVEQQIAALLGRCDAVLVVDRGSSDATRERAREAGARVLDLAAPAGEGEALRAGMQLARELGYIGALLPGPTLPDREDLDCLVLAHHRAPEALIMGVGPGQAIAGKEWDEARALAEGREAEPVPSFRPPRSSGVHGQAEAWFERLVQTRYAYPWGGPRILPLQSLLRRPFREPGASVHLELLGLAAHAGVPTVEVEMRAEPARYVPTCRKAALRLVARFMPLSLAASASLRLGLGGGYAPPTSSPLGLALAASLAVAFALLGAGCLKPVPPAIAEAGCATDLAQHQWPGAGDPRRAFEELRSQRDELAALWVEQGVAITDPSFEGERLLRAILARDEDRRLRLRFLGPMGITVLDYVQAEGRWHLTLPSARISQAGTLGEPLALPVAGDPPAIPPDRVARLFLSLEDAHHLGWRDGSCAVLEARDREGLLTRRFSYRRQGEGWEVAQEDLLGSAGLELVAHFEDYRAVGATATWAYRQHLQEPTRGTQLTFETRSLRTEDIDPAIFAFPTTEQ
jgi:hypothetical protein